MDYECGWHKDARTSDPAWRDWQSPPDCQDRPALRGLPCIVFTNLRRNAGVKSGRSRIQRTRAPQNSRELLLRHQIIPALGAGFEMSTIIPKFAFPEVAIKVTQSRDTKFIAGAHSTTFQAGR